MERREDKKVDDRFRLLYALGMVFVVSGHAEGGGVSLFYDWFPPYAFHLGLFVFCSGYFWKDDYVRDVPGFLRRKARSLLLPMYLWNLFYAALVLLSRKADFTIGMNPSFRTLVTMPLYEGSQFEYNMGAWFVVPLFAVEAVTVLFRRLFPVSGSRMREIAAFSLSLLLGAFGVFLAQRGFRRGWELLVVRSLYFLPFFSLGILYRRVLEPYDRLPHGVYFTVVFLIQYLIIILCGRIPYYTPSRCDDFVEGGIVPFVVGYTAIAFWLRMARILEPALGKDRWVNAIAENSYSIMVNQFLGFMLVKAGFAFLKLTTEHCQSFDMGQFRTELSYFYAPGGRSFFLFYLAAGLLIPILMQKAADFLKRTLFPGRRGSADTGRR
jgi:Fucose 4-O-acetylase and related acetyltransferases